MRRIMPSSRGTSSIRSCSMIRGCGSIPPFYPFPLSLPTLTRKVDDIKPYGIYVTRGPGGVAQIDHYHLAVSASGVYLDEQLCGTPVYMAPELIRNEPRRYTRQSDVYAAGLLVLGILSGRGMQELLGGEGVGLSGGPMALLSEICARG